MIPVWALLALIAVFSKPGEGNVPPLQPTASPTLPIVRLPGDDQSRDPQNPYGSDL